MELGFTLIILLKKIRSMNVCCVPLFYFQVTHVEPWEKGSRKTAGQTGMCGGVSRSTCIFQFFCVSELSVYLEN